MRQDDFKKGCSKLSFFLESASKKVSEKVSYNGFEGEGVLRRVFRRNVLEELS